MKYISNPWSKYCSDEIKDYLKNTRHMVLPNAFSIIDSRFPEEVNKLTLTEVFALRNTILKSYKIDNIFRFKELFKITYIIEESIKNMEENGELTDENIEIISHILGISVCNGKIQESLVLDEKMKDLLGYFQSYWLLLNVFEDLNNAAIHICERVGFGEEAPDIKWISDLEKKSECVEMNEKSTLILSYSQISDFVKVIIEVELTNEDSLYHFKKSIDEMEKSILKNPEDIIDRICKEKTVYRG